MRERALEAQGADAVCGVGESRWEREGGVHADRWGVRGVSIYSSLSVHFQESRQAEIIECLCLIGKTAPGRWGLENENEQKTSKKYRSMCHGNRELFLFIVICSLCPKVILSEKTKYLPLPFSTSEEQPQQDPPSRP